MSCIKNPKRFIWKYLGDHEERIERIGKFMNSSTSFMVRFECIRCGAQRVRHFVSEEELLRLGVTIEAIEKARNDIF